MYLLQWYIKYYSDSGTPARPSGLSPIKTQSTSIQIGWELPICNGGITIRELNIQYSEVFRFTGFRSISNIDPSLREYTITNLTPDTRYTFRMYSISTDFRRSSPSVALTTSTLPAGKRYCESSSF